jgi:primary-amine oxidase
MSTEQAILGLLGLDGYGTTSKTQLPHPLDLLSVTDSDRARQVILDARGSNVAIQFRSIALEEPPKKELWPFLELEHAGRLNENTPRPARQARVQYDVIRGKDVEYTESFVDLVTGRETQYRVVDKVHQAALTTYDN